MARRNRERGKGNPRRGGTTIDRARDELFHAIRHCGVMNAPEAEQQEWMDETVAFLAMRYPELSQNDHAQLKRTGLRFCQPVIPHGAEHTAMNEEGANVA